MLLFADATTVEIVHAQYRMVGTTRLQSLRSSGAAIPT